MRATTSDEERVREGLCNIRVGYRNFWGRYILGRGDNKFKTSAFRKELVLS